VNETRDILERYLHQVGMARPADSAQQFAVTMLRQQADHLDDVLRHNLPGDPETRSRIIREFIYGAVPCAAEAGLREEILQQSAEYLSGTARTSRPPGT
jgi:hypothetical protein